MLQKTRGIVIGFITYRETSVIVKVFTEQFGLQSYIENGVRTSKGRGKIALFQPLTLLDMVVYHKEQGGIQRMAEVKCHTPYLTIPFDFAKSSIALFLTEVLSKALKEETGNASLFEFLFQSLHWFDQTEKHFESFHLIFLFKLSFFLGFSPHAADEIIGQLQEHNLLIDSSFKNAIDDFIDAEYPFPPRTDRFSRGQVLDAILKFYQLHVADFGEVKSLAVLQEMMR